MMTAASTPTATRTILALDLGKDKCVACRYEPATGEVQFRSLDTGREAHRRRIERRPDPESLFGAA